MDGDLPLNLSFFGNPHRPQLSNGGLCFRCQGRIPAIVYLELGIELRQEGVIVRMGNARIGGKKENGLAFRKHGSCVIICGKHCDSVRTWAAEHLLN